MIHIVIWQLAVWSPWILFLPLAVRLAIRFPVDTSGLVTLHIGAALLIAAIHAPWFVWVSTETSPFRDIEGTRFGVFQYFFIFWLALDLLLYAATLGHARSRWFQRKNREQEMYLAALELKLSGSGGNGDPPGSQWHALKLEHFTVRKGSANVRLSAADITWIEAEDYYIRFHTRADSYLVRMSLSKLEKRLDPSQFVRIHRSTIVNIDHLQSVHRKPGGGRWVSMTDGTDRRVSRTGYAELRSRIEMLS